MYNGEQLTYEEESRKRVILSPVRDLVFGFGGK